MKRWEVAWVAGLLVAGVLGVGCGGGRSASEAAAPTAALRLATTTTPVDVAAAPARVDAPYAQAVIDALDRSLGDAVRVFARDGGPSAEFVTHLRALYDGPGYDQQFVAWGRIAAQAIDNVRRVPGDPVTRVRRLIGASPTCLFFTAERRLDRVFVTATPSDTPTFVQLLRKKPERDPGGANPTRWSIVTDGSNPDGSVPANPCGAGR